MFIYSHSLFNLVVYLFIYLILLSCVRPPIAYPPSVYDTEGVAIVTDPYAGGGKYGPPAHSVLKFKTKDSVCTVESYKYYLYMNRGEKFRIRYNANNPTIYDIRFDEPIFNKNEELVKTEGCIIIITNGDSAKGLGKMNFVYEVDTKKRDNSGSYYIGFKDTYQYIKTSQQQLAKRGRKYVVYYNKIHPQYAILYLDSILDPVHTKDNYFFYKAVRKIQERYKPIIRLLTKTLRLNPKNEFALFDRGKAYYQLDRNSKAEKDFTAYIGLRGNTYDGYWYRGIVRIQRGEYDLALADLNKAIEINPITEPDLYYYRGMIYYNMNNYERAVEDYSRAIEINSRGGRYYYNRAAAKVKQTGREKEGDEDYRQAGSLGLKQSPKALDKSKSGQHTILAGDIKKPWPKSYLSLTSEIGVMPYNIRADYASMSFPYQIVDQSGNTTQGNFQASTNFFQASRVGFTTVGIEAGKSRRGYFITRVVFPWIKSGSFDIGWGRNIAIQNERVALLRPELTISYFNTHYHIGRIDYGSGTLIVPGQASTKQINGSYSYIDLGEFIWSLKPKLSLWIFPKNILSFKLNGGYVLPFAEMTKYKIDFFSPRPGDPYKTTNVGLRKFNPDYSTSSNIPLNKLYKMSGFFFSIELVAALSW
jgi:tetratricopeptide (TPR) repeat protein